MAQSLLLVNCKCGHLRNDGCVPPDSAGGVSRMERDGREEHAPIEEPARVSRHLHRVRLVLDARVKGLRHEEIHTDRRNQ